MAKTIHWSEHRSKKKGKKDFEKDFFKLQFLEKLSGMWENIEILNLLQQKEEETI